jgi:hypothetical protein
MKRPILPRLTVVALVVVALSVGAFALTAANTVPDTKAGDGSGTITGYVATSVHYTLNGTDPSKLDSVAFTLDSTPVAGSTLKAQLVSGGNWYTCTNSGTSVTCATTSPQATVLAANNLRVIIAD